MRILHVEDDEDTRTLVAFILEREGWELVSLFRCSISVGDRIRPRVRRKVHKIHKLCAFLWLNRRGSTRRLRGRVSFRDRW
jgi:hypothetical protein